MSGIASALSSRLNRPLDARTMLIGLAVVLAVLATGGAFVVLPRLGESGALAAIHDGLVSRGFRTAVAVGLAAQIVDGALGMAYGVTSTTFLLSTGVLLHAAASALRQGTRLRR